MEWYSASADDLETTTCFLLFHDMSDLPRKIQYPVIERLVKGHHAQSVSQYVVRCSGPFEENGPFEKNNNPWPGAPLR
jgi:hypothetical protein